MTAYPTPRELPELRHDLTQWYATDAATALMGTLAETGTVAARNVTARHRAALAVAGLYYVSPDMTDLAVTIGRGLETYAVLADEDLPEDHGLLMWGHRFIAPEKDGLRFAPAAVSWSAVGANINVVLYEHLPTADPPAIARAYRHQLAEAGTPAGAQPDLMPMWESRLRADGRERPWSSTEDVDPDSHRVLRTLLATWLLIRQPADGRRTIHEAEGMVPSRAAQKRIARGGGDPTRTIRYVTLRQALRRSDDSQLGGGDQAGRIYRHRWFVRPHRANQFYPSTGEHQRIWRGPYLVVPAGCEGAPILGGERVNVLRR